jgi:hypothetical protein
MHDQHHGKRQEEPSPTPILDPVVKSGVLSDFRIFKQNERNDSKNQYRSDREANLAEVVFILRKPVLNLGFGSGISLQDIENQESETCHQEVTASHVKDYLEVITEVHRSRILSSCFCS